ncbi:MAG: hypothetical protein ACWA5A_09700 [Marinibacterium sp.]
MEVPSDYVLAPEAERLALARPARTVTVAGRTHNFPGIPAPDVLVYLPGGRFAITVTATDCSVQVRPGQSTSVSERQMLIARYKADREALIAAGTHEIVIRPTPRPIQEFAHRSLRRNPSGGCTLSRVIWNLKFIRGQTEALPGRDCDLSIHGAGG